MSKPAQVVIIISVLLFMTISPSKAADWRTLEVITLGNVGRLTKLQSINLNHGQVKGVVSFYDDQTLHVAVAHGEDQLSLLKVWPLESVLHDLKRYTKYIDDMEFSPEGDWLGIVSVSGGVDLWGMLDGVFITTIGGDDVFSTLAFHPHSPSLVTGSDNEVVEWDLETAFKLRTFRMPATDVEDIVFSPDGSLLAVGGGTGVTLVDWQNSEDLLTPVTDTANREVIFNQRGDMLAFISEMGQEVGLWNLDTGNRILIKEGGRQVSGNDILFNFDGQLFMVASSDGLEIYDGTTGRHLVTLTHFDSEITTMSLSNDGRFLVTGHVNGEVNIWGVPPGF